MSGTSAALAAPPDASSAAPTLTLTCVLLLSPLRAADGTWRVQRETFPVGDVLECYLPEREAIARVTVNGAVITPKAYATYVPPPGAEVWIFPQWGYVPGLAELALYAGVSLVVGLATAAASHFLFRPKPVLLPPQPALTEAPEERTFSWQGIRTAIGPGNVVPVVYGRHRVGGQLLRASVDHARVILDDSQTPVYKPLQHVEAGFVSRVVVQCNGHGFANYEAILIEGVLSPPHVNNVWTIEVIDANTFYLEYSESVTENQVIPYQGTGTARRYHSGPRRYQAVAQAPTLSLLLALGEGPIGAVLTETIEINGQPIQNFAGVQLFTRLGTADQTPISELLEVGNTFADGRVIDQAGLVYTTTDTITAFVLNISFDQGLFVLNERGEKESNWVTLMYRLSIHGTGGWTDWATFTIVGDRTSPVRMGIRREGLSLNLWDIQVAFVEGAHLDEVRARYVPTLESVTEFTAGVTAYPYTALLGLRALATDQLSGGLPNVTVEILGRTVRVGSLVPTETWSQNPAWCVLDLLTNVRYGRGRPDAEIDLAAFSVYAAYCDQLVGGEARHVLNYVLDRETRAQTAFLETMGGSRGILLKTFGLWTPRPTRVETPTALLSWTNSTNVQLTYLRDSDQVNVLEARFLNEENHFDNDVLTWPPVDDWPAVVEKASLDLRGVTKPSRVIRALQYELNRRRLENVLLEMDCSAEALTVQMHDLFRFSHPLPGWGMSGRVQAGSTTTFLALDEAVTLEAGVPYLVYVRHANDAIDVREISELTLGSVTELHLASALSQVPTPRMATWTFGRLSTDASTRLFRVTNLQRRSDATVHLEAVIHNPTIYDDPVGTPLPPITDLFNPLGPSPPLVSLIATELTRIQPSGASLRVVNLAWDVAQLSSQYAPYGGATIWRRVVLANSQAGQALAGQMAFGVALDTADANTNYALLAQPRGHVLEFDDYTVVTGTTYMYRVIPVSQRDVPNNPGAREVVITVTGPTTPGYFPGTPQHLRLRGHPSSVTTFEGRDIHLEWDAVPASPLFSDTFFVQDYLLQVWAPAQLYLLRTLAVPVAPRGAAVQWSYTYDQHTQDQLAVGQTGARRDLLFLVWARTNTGLLSLDPATLTVSNPPPDMGDMIPAVTPLFQAAIIEWQQFVEPRDFSHYEVRLDTVTPPQAVYQQAGAIFQKVLVGDLVAGVTYYTQIVPHDTFGAGMPSHIASVVPYAISGEDLDTTPPAVPTGVGLTTGVATNPDGTTSTWVEATWTPNTEPDLGGYQVHFRLAPSLVPTVFSAPAGTTAVRWEAVPGQAEVLVKVAAFDRLRNFSAFSAEVSLVTSADTTPPAAPTNLTAFGSIRSIALLWTPPADADYRHSQVWVSPTNDRSTAFYVRDGISNATLEQLGPSDTLYCWIRAVDRSGNVSAFHPLSPTAGVAGTSGQLDTTFISSLAANKITTGTLTALVNIGVGGNVFLDGVNRQIAIYDETPTLRVLLGRLGVSSTDYGLWVFDQSGVVMFDILGGGVTAAGIKAGVITSSHLRTDTAVITVAAQIANAIIGSAHVNELSADKIATGTLQAFFWIGAGTRMYLDAVNRQFVVRDDADTTRVWIGKLAGGGTDYGMYIFNALGQLMWDFSAGATTQGISDFAITSAKIGTAQIQTAHIADANITDAKIVSLQAGKITTGTLTVTMGVGSEGRLYLDGAQNQLSIFDFNSTLRVLLGKLGTGTTDYGLAINDATGQPMWLLGSGATTGGITPHAVSESLLHAASGGGLVNGSETEYASVTFSSLNTGDQVLLIGSLTYENDDVLGNAALSLREDSTSGTVLHQVLTRHVPDTGGIDFAACMTVTSVYTAGGALSNKKFVLSAAGPGSGPAGTVSQVRLTALRRQR